jgi:hypothetical protein
MLPFAGTGGNQMARRMLYVKSSQVRKQRTFTAKNVRRKEP